MAVLASTAGAGSYLLGSSPLLAASVVAVCALGVVSLCAARGSMPSCALLDGAHQTEVAILSRELDGAAERDAQAIRVRTTSQGLRLSKGTPGGAELYTFSHTGRELDERSAQVTARTLLAISAYPSGELLRGEAGIRHLLVQPR